MSMSLNWLYLVRARKAAEICFNYENIIKKKLQPGASNYIYYSINIRNKCNSLNCMGALSKPLNFYSEDLCLTQRYSIQFNWQNRNLYCD